MGTEFPDEIREWVAQARWRDATSAAYREWPHAYSLRKWARESGTEALYLKCVNHIRESGFDGRFYRMHTQYFSEAGKTYWTMPGTIEANEGINRCDDSETWEARNAAGRLPAPAAPRNANG